MAFISITGAIKWDIFVFYIVSGVIFVTCICVIVSCLFLCCPANSTTYQQHLAQAKYNRSLNYVLCTTEYTWRPNKRVGGKNPKNQLTYTHLYFLTLDKYEGSRF